MEESLEVLRHTASHIMALAVKRVFKKVRFGIGPAIENGFYYDFELPRPLTIDDLPVIEEEMRKIAKEDLKIEKLELSKEEATKKLEKEDQPYKLELVKELEDEKITFYRIDDFEDLCRGPHLEQTGKVKHFKLLSVAGAYWRGNEKNPMLTRIYATAFPTEKELNDYLELLEEAKKRDHRKLGRELDLFVFSPLVGPGLPLFTPKGTIIIDELQKRVETICRRYGFQKVNTPHLAKIDLYKLSGHADKFGDELLRICSDRYSDLVMKPVQCPHQTQIYASRPRSYRELPIRYMESNKQYRAEKPGEVGGLNRVLAITVEDGHSFCRIDQVKEEVKNMVQIIRDFYTDLGMWGNHWVSLSVRDYGHPEKYIGEPKDWDHSEKMLQEVSDEMGLDAKVCEGEAALYGPKLDFMFRDATGREIQIPTVQLDFATPKRFSLVYKDEKGMEVSPVMVHRAILGSYERFLALILEHFAGALPFWLSPVQIKVLPISDKFDDYAQKICQELNEKGFRVELDNRSETLGARIREAQLTKIPYMVIIGQKESESGTIAVRSREKGDLGAMTTQDYLELLKKES